MAKYVYPAVFAPAAEGGYVVTFPDWEGATQGDTVAEAIEMAADFLGLATWTVESNAQEFPAATAFEKVAAPQHGFVNLIAVDTDVYAEIIERENNPIKYARKKAGLNMKKLADLLGAPYRTVQDWNAGRRMPPDWVQRLIIEKIEANA